MRIDIQEAFLEDGDGLSLVLNHDKGRTVLDFFASANPSVGIVLKFRDMTSDQALQDLVASHLPPAPT